MSYVSPLSGIPGLSLDLSSPVSCLVFYLVLYLFLSCHFSFLFFFSSSSANGSSSLTFFLQKILVYLLLFLFFLLLFFPPVDDSDCFYIALFSALSSRLTALACDSTGVNSFFFSSLFFWISTEVVYLQRWHGWSHMKLLAAVSARSACTIQPCCSMSFHRKATYVRCWELGFSVRFLLNSQDMIVCRR